MREPTTATIDTEWLEHLAQANGRLMALQALRRHEIDTAYYLDQPLPSDFILGVEQHFMARKNELDAKYQEIAKKGIKG